MTRAYCRRVLYIVKRQSYILIVVCVLIAFARKLVTNRRHHRSAVEDVYILSRVPV